MVRITSVAKTELKRALENDDRAHDEIGWRLKRRKRRDRVRLQQEENDESIN